MPPNSHEWLPTSSVQTCNKPTSEATPTLLDSKFSPAVDSSPIARLFRRRANRSLHTLFASFPVAAGGIHQPAHAPHRARTRRTQLDHYGPRQRPLPHRGQPHRAKTLRHLTRRPTPRHPTLRLGPRRDARRRHHLRRDGRPIGRHQHGLPRAQSRQRRRRLRHDD